MSGTSASEVDEVLADVVFDLFARRSLARFHGTNSFRRWLSAVSRIAALRQRSRRSPQAPEGRAEGVAPSIDPAAHLALAEQHERLRLAMTEIPHNESEALRLRFAEDRTLRETARELGERYAMSASRVVARGLSHLERLLRENGSAKRQGL